MNIHTLLTCFIVGCSSNLESDRKTLIQNNMEINWHHKGPNIHISMSAPTEGWVAIGFNPSPGIKGTYLLMGHIEEGKPDVVEHYTLSPGNYRTLESLECSPRVKNIRGSEKEGTSLLSFTIPTRVNSAYHQDLSEGNEYNLIIAYSREDDFQHHSMMRTSVRVEL